MSTRAEDLRPGDCWIEPNGRYRRAVRMLSARSGSTPTVIIIEVEYIKTGIRHELHLYRTTRRRVLP